MKLITPLFAAIGMTVLAPIANADELKCDVGPISKTYGKTSWLVYSCNDGHSIVAVSSPGNPAAPFYFVLHPGEQGYQIEGEGTGDKAESDAALADLKALSVEQIDAVIAETKRPQKSN
jgi:hypothetical protein